MTPEQAAALRVPFPPDVIGKLPKLTCRDCTDARGKVCDKHAKRQCDRCGNYLSTAHVDLDYVGHAAVTARLLDVDPGWTWEPAATDPATGAPLMDAAGLWIRLTVGGVSRIGFGDGPDPKQRISDAIRNAAMRFGVALDLWSKHPIEGGDSENAAPDAGQAAVDVCVALRKEIAQVGQAKGMDLPGIAADFMESTGGSDIREALEPELQSYLHRLRTGEA